jgi:hypothetical protein
MTNLTHKKMKNRYLIVLFLLIGVSTYVIHAQNPLKIELLSGTSLNIRNAERVFSNWGNGYIFGGGVAYQLIPAFDLAMYVAYQGYPYKGGNLELIAPDQIGWKQSANGSASNILECSFAIRNTPKKSLFYPMFSLRLGVLRTHIGEIIINEWDEQNPENIYHQKYSKTGIIHTNGFAALGLGFNFPVNENSRIMLESRITQTFDLEQTFIPIVLTFQHDLNKNANR